MVAKFKGSTDDERQINGMKTKKLQASFHLKNLPYDNYKMVIGGFRQ